MTPEQYEHFIGEKFKENGYEVVVSPLSNDWGLDVIATKGQEKLGIQAKMYGDSNRKVNRSAIMELASAARYQDCTKAILATNGKLMPDALKVADKLGVEIQYVPIEKKTSNIIDEKTKVENQEIINTEENNEYPSFGVVWEKYIKPLEGKTLYNTKGSNEILKVDNGGITRITSTGNTGKIQIEGFRFAYNELLKNGKVKREYINQNFAKRCSSGIVLVLLEIPFIEGNSSEIRLKN